MSALWARAVPCVSDFISLKDEYRNMAGGVLPLTNDPMPNINTNKQGWGTDAAGTDLTEGDKYKDLINVKGAKFLDLVNSSSVKIDDADDLKEALKEYDVEMSIAFNDNPDNDEFRKAYIVVITGLKDKGETPVEPITGNVRVADAYKNRLDDFTGKLDVAKGGTNYLTMSFDAPEWAEGNGDGELTFDAKLYVGNDWYATIPMTSAATQGSAQVKRSTDSYSMANQAGVFTISAAMVAEGDISVVIDNIQWKYNVVKFIDQNKNALTTEATTTAKLETKDFAANTSAALQFKMPTGSYVSASAYSIAGATGDHDDAVLSETKALAMNTQHTLGKTGSAVYFANGNGFVTVTVTVSENAITEYSIKTNKALTTTKSLFNTDLTAANSAKVSDFKDADGSANTSDQTIAIQVANANASVITNGVAVDKDQTTTLTIAVGDITDTTGATAYKVSIPVYAATDFNGATLKTGATPVATYTGTVEQDKTYTWTAFANKALTQDLIVDVDSVKITPVLGPQLQKSVWMSNGTITLTFDKAIKEASVVPGSFEITGAFIASATVDPADAKNVILNVSGEAAGTDITIKAKTALTDLEGNPANATLTITIDDGDFGNDNVEDTAV